MRNAMTRVAARLVPIALLTLPGCFKLSRDTPVLEQYVLGAAAETVAVASPPAPAAMTVGLRRLDLAPYLAIPAVVVRRGAHQVIVSQYHRWAEEPGGGINRAVARYLALAAPVRRADVAPWATDAKYDYLLQLHITRFEGVTAEDTTATDGEVVMYAGWEILRQQDGSVLAHGATRFRQPNWQVGDYAGLVAHLDRGLNRLALDIAACLGTVAAAPAATNAISCASRPD